MPIPVSCPSCKASFTVSDKFGGKEGPCPKCKAKIKIPEAPPPADEVKIHGPSDAPPGKTATGQKSTRPIPRRETKIGAIPLVASIVGTIVTLAGAFFLRAVWQEQFAIRSIMLTLVSIPIARAGYGFLRNDDVEPYTGKNAWARAAICGVLYAAIWGVIYYLFFVKELQPYDPWQYLFFLPPAGLIGAAIAFLTFEIEFHNGIAHFLFYVVVTLILGWLCELQMPWVHLPV